MDAAVAEPVARPCLHVVGYLLMYALGLFQGGILTLSHTSISPAITPSPIPSPYVTSYATNTFNPARSTFVPRDHQLDPPPPPPWKMSVIDNVVPQHSGDYYFAAPSYNADPTSLVDHLFSAGVNLHLDDFQGLLLPLGTVLVLCLLLAMDYLFIYGQKFHKRYQEQLAADRKNSELGQKLNQNEQLTVLLQQRIEELDVLRDWRARLESTHNNEVKRLHTLHDNEVKNQHDLHARVINHKNVAHLQKVKELCDSNKLTYREAEKLFESAQHSLGFFKELKSTQLKVNEIKAQIRSVEFDNVNKLEQALEDKNVTIRLHKKQLAEAHEKINSLRASNPLKQSVVNSNETLVTRVREQADRIKQLENTILSNKEAYGKELGLKQEIIKTNRRMLGAQNGSDQNIKKLKKRLQRARKTVRSKNDEYHKLLTDRQNDFNSQTQASATENRKLQQKINDLEKTINTAKEQHAEELKDKQNEVMEARTSVASKIRDIQARDDKIKQKDGQLQKNDDQIKDMNGQIKKKDDQIREQGDQIKKQDQQVKERDDQLQKKDDEITEKNGQIKAMDDQIKQDKEVIAQKDRTIEDANNQGIEQVRLELAETYRKGHQEVYAAKDNLDAQVKDQHGIIQSLTATQAENTEEIRRLQQERSDMITSMKDTQNGHNATVQQLKVQYEQELENLRVQRDNFQKIINFKSSQLESEREKLEKTEEKAEEKVKELAEGFKKLQTDLEDAQWNLEDANGIIQGIDEEHAEQIKGIEDAHANEIEDTNAAWQIDVDGLEKKIRQMKQRIEDLERKVRYYEDLLAANGIPVSSGGDDDDDDDDDFNPHHDLDMLGGDHEQSTDSSQGPSGGEASSGRNAEDEAPFGNGSSDTKTHFETRQPSSSTYSSNTTRPMEPSSSNSSASAGVDATNDHQSRGAVNASSTDSESSQPSNGTGSANNGIGPHSLLSGSRTLASINNGVDVPSTTNNSTANHQVETDQASNSGNLSSDAFGAQAPMSMGQAPVILHNDGNAPPADNSSEAIKPAEMQRVDSSTYSYNATPQTTGSGAATMDRMDQIEVDHVEDFEEVSEDADGLEEDSEDEDEDGEWGEDGEWDEDEDDTDADDEDHDGDQPVVADATSLGKQGRSNRRPGKKRAWKPNQRRRRWGGFLVKDFNPFDDPEIGCVEEVEDGESKGGGISGGKKKGRKNGKKQASKNQGTSEGKQRPKNRSFKDDGIVDDKEKPKNRSPHHHKTKDTKSQSKEASSSIDPWSFGIVAPAPPSSNQHLPSYANTRPPITFGLGGNNINQANNNVTAPQPSIPSQQFPSYANTSAPMTFGQSSSNNSAFPSMNGRAPLAGVMYSQHAPPFASAGAPMAFGQSNSGLMQSQHAPQFANTGASMAFGQNNSYRDISSSTNRFTPSPGPMQSQRAPQFANTGAPIAFGQSNSNIDSSMNPPTPPRGLMQSQHPPQFTNTGALMVFDQGSSNSNNRAINNHPVPQVSMPNHQAPSGAGSGVQVTFGLRSNENAVNLSATAASFSPQTPSPNAPATNTPPSTTSSANTPPANAPKGPRAQFNQGPMGSQFGNRSIVAKNYTPPKPGDWARKGKK